MGKPTGFMEIEKIDRDYKPVSERISNYKERKCRSNFS